MANQHHVNRWKKGKNHWNKWAEGRLKAKKKLWKEKRWEEGQRFSSLTDAAWKWWETASVDFSDHEFSETADFSEVIFPGNANFTGAKFRQKSSFASAQFLLDADFSNSVFYDDTKFYAGFEGCAEFERAKFEGNAWICSDFKDRVNFTDAEFSLHASFWQAKFRDQTRFTRTRFGRTTEFGHAKFKSDSYFAAIRTKGPISFDGAAFEKVAPKFSQALFQSPPRLDNVEIVEARSFQWTGDKLRAANYRDLKRLASETKDHVREQQFFASELRERRGNDDPVWSARWWFGFAYELFSDFGRSFLRPLKALVALSIGFFGLYVISRELSAWQNCGSDDLVPLGNAAYLSLVTSLPFIGLGKGDLIKQVSLCLYGAQALPLGISLLRILQTVLSTVLIFLFLLAVRNHFRIK